MKDQAKTKLIRFLDARVYNPILKAPEKKYSASDRKILERVKRKTEQLKDGYRKYQSAGQVRQEFEDDLRSEAAKKVNADLKRLNLPGYRTSRRNFLSWLILWAWHAKEASAGATGRILHIRGTRKNQKHEPKLGVNSGARPAGETKRLNRPYAKHKQKGARTSSRVRRSRRRSKHKRDLPQRRRARKDYSFQSHPPARMTEALRFYRFGSAGSDASLIVSFTIFFPSPEWSATSPSETMPTSLFCQLRIGRCRLLLFLHQLCRLENILVSKAVNHLQSHHFMNLRVPGIAPSAVRRSGSVVGSPTRTLQAIRHQACLDSVCACSFWDLISS